METVIIALFAAVWPPLWAFAWRKILSLLGIHQPFAWTCAVWGWPSAGFAVLFPFVGQWLAGLTSAATAIAALICWWLSRRKRKRSPKLTGAKSRALLAAVVARMREVAKPRQVLRPVPGEAS